MTFPRTITEALAAIHPGCELRAGGTDFQERCALGLAGRPIVDLRDLAELERIEWSEAGVRIGARVTIAAVAKDPDIRRHYPGFAQAADALATPQIRAVATVGGNLLQRSRCWVLPPSPASDVSRAAPTVARRARAIISTACALIWALCCPTPLDTWDDTAGLRRPTDCGGRPGSQHPRSVWRWAGSAIRSPAWWPRDSHGGGFTATRSR